jgi:ketosteroid isomerase-like protein
MTAEQEILQREKQLANAKRALDLDALQRLYADDLIMTGVLGEPTCGKAAIIDEAKRGITQRQAAAASGRHFEASAENEDMKVAVHGDTAIASYRFVVRIKSQSTDVLRRYRTTNVWMKRDGGWQIVAGHMAFIVDANQAAVLTGEARQS